jgi:hypothetical protein
MTADFGILVIYGRNLPEDAKNEFMRRAYQLTDMDARLDFIWAYFEETKHLAPVVKKPETRKGARRTGAAAATSYAGGNSSGGNAYDDEDEPAYPTVNPTSGLPMVNNIIDVGGNAYGQGNFGEL